MRATKKDGHICSSVQFSWRRHLAFFFIFYILFEKGSSSRQGSAISDSVMCPIAMVLRYEGFEKAESIYILPSSLLVNGLSRTDAQKRRDETERRL